MEESHEAESPDAHQDSGPDNGSLEERVLEESGNKQDSEESNAGKLGKNYFANHGNQKYENLKLASAKSETERPGRERSNHGAVAIIYYENQDTGKIEVLFEQRPANDKLESERGKLSLIGGAIDIVDGRSEGSLEALMRELDEEIGDEKAKTIIRKALDSTRELYTILSDNVGGEIANTYVYKIKIYSAKEWNIVKRTYLADGSGTARVLSSDEITSTPKNGFAFSFGETAHGFVARNNMFQTKNAENYKSKTHDLISKPSLIFSNNPADCSVHYNRAA